jgi:thioredoxin 1
MATVQLTEETFDEVAQGEGIVLIDFWASWCGPCMRFGPVYEKVSERHPDIVFAKVDTEDQPGLSARFDVRSIPTVMAVRDGVIVYAEPGALPENSLESIIEQVRALDMDEIRSRLAQS